MEKTPKEGAPKPEIAGKRLGKRPARHDPRTLWFAKHFNTSALPAPPALASWTKPVKQWPMMGKDTIGDWTCAAAGQLIEEWTASLGATVVPPGNSIIAAYSVVTGYGPVTHANGSGAAGLDVLNCW